METHEIVSAVVVYIFVSSKNSIIVEIFEVAEIDVDSPEVAEIHRGSGNIHEPVAIQVRDNQRIRITGRRKVNPIQFDAAVAGDPSPVLSQIPRAESYN